MWATQAKENDTCAVSFSSCKGVRSQARRARTRGAFSWVLPAVLFNPAVSSEQGRETVNTNKAFFKGVNYEFPKQCDISTTWVPLPPSSLTVRVDLSARRLRKSLSNAVCMGKKKKKKGMPETNPEGKKKVVKKLFSFLIICVCVRVREGRNVAGSANSGSRIGPNKVSNVSA